MNTDESNHITDISFLLRGGEFSEQYCMVRRTISNVIYKQQVPIRLFIRMGLDRTLGLTT